jgi:hypothetical protein
LVSTAVPVSLAVVLELAFAAVPPTGRGSCANRHVPLVVDFDEAVVESSQFASVDRPTWLVSIAARQR